MWHGMIWHMEWILKKGDSSDARQRNLFVRRSEGPLKCRSEKWLDPKVICFFVPFWFIPGTSRHSFLGQLRWLYTNLASGQSLTMYLALSSFDLQIPSQLICVFQSSNFLCRFLVGSFFPLVHCYLFHMTFAAIADQYGWLQNVTAERFPWLSKCRAGGW